MIQVKLVERNACKTVTRRRSKKRDPRCERKCVKEHGKEGMECIQRREKVKRKGERKKGKVEWEG